MKISKKILLLTAGLMVIGFLTFGGHSALAETDTVTGLVYTVEEGEATITGFIEPVGYRWELAVPDTLGGVPVTGIGEGAFKECSRLWRITIPDSVTSIGREAFNQCITLESIAIPDGVTNISYRAFWRCFSLSAVLLPDNVTVIGEQAFEGCGGLTTITIPDGVTSIGREAFRSCSLADGITIPDGVTSIGEGVFSGCDFNSITIPDNITSIGSNAFYNCMNLTAVTIPDTVTSIGERAFQRCSRLETITLPDNISMISNYMLSGCTSLTEITIPTNVTSIGGDAFAECENLTEITIPENVTTIGGWAFAGCIRLTSITIPDSVTSLGSGVFSFCTELTSITLPDTITTLNWLSFSNCASLTSINIPDSVRMINLQAFENCSSLTSITIPESVTYIGEDVFNNCPPGLTVYGYGGSYAEEYADGEDIEFFELAEINPTVAAFDKNPVNHADVSITIDFNDASSVIDVHNLGTSIGTANYSVADNILTIRKEYLAVQPGGDLELTVEFDRGTGAALVLEVWDSRPTWPGDGAMTSSGTTRTKTTLNWTAAEDNTGISEYRLYQNGVEVAAIAGDVCTYELVELFPGTRYHFEIKAVDTDGYWTANGLAVYVTTRQSGGGGSGTGHVPAVNAFLTAGSYQESLTVSIDNKKGMAAVSLSRYTLNNAFENIKTIKIVMPRVKGVNSYSIELPPEVLASELPGRNIDFECEYGTITLPSNMFANSFGIDDVSIAFKRGDKSLLPENVQETIGGRPLVQLTLTSGGQEQGWRNPDAPVAVSVPYMLAGEEKAEPELIAVRCVDEAGNMAEVPSGKYDLAAKAVTFNTTKFGSFPVVFVRKVFNDLDNVPWAREQIEVLASKGILKGTSEMKYTPEANISRAEFLYSLVRTLGVDARVDVNFDDINIDAYYYKEIGIAKKMGFTAGSGNNRFNPDQSITRQDMMALTDRALRILGVVQNQDTASVLDEFADKSMISAYAANSVASVVKERLIVGSGGRINPLGNTKRAEAAVFLYKIYNGY